LRPAPLPGAIGTLLGGRAAGATLRFWRGDLNGWKLRSSLPLLRGGLRSRFRQRKNAEGDIAHRKQRRPRFCLAHPTPLNSGSSASSRCGERSRRCGIERKILGQCDRGIGMFESIQIKTFLNRKVEIVLKLSLKRSKASQENARKSGLFCCRATASINPC
jgi:hypothetical protein